MQRNLYEASFLLRGKKKKKNTNCSSSQSHNKGFSKRPILINSIFSLTHKHPVYHQTLKRPLICNFSFLFFFSVSRELAHLAGSKNTDLYCCILFWWGPKHVGGRKVVFFFTYRAAHGSVNESVNWWLRAGTLMTEVPSVVSASLLTGRAGMGVRETQNNVREMERWERNAGLKTTPRL